MDRRRSRMRRTESERMRRLAELEGGGGGIGAPPAATIGPPMTNIDDLLDADIERADISFDRGLQRRKSSFALIGMDDEDSHTDRVVCVILAFLLVAFLIMVVMILLR